MKKVLIVALTIGLSLGFVAFAQRPANPGSGGQCVRAGIGTLLSLGAVPAAAQQKVDYSAFAGEDGIRNEVRGHAPPRHPLDARPHARACQREQPHRPGPTRRPRARRLRRPRDRRPHARARQRRPARHRERPGRRAAPALRPAARRGGLVPRPTHRRNRARSRHAYTVVTARRRDHGDAVRPRPARRRAVAEEGRSR
jgi:hypothetical protein